MSVSTPPSKPSCVRRTDCRLCNSKRVELAFALSATPIGDDYVSSGRLNEIQPDYPLDLFLCRDCAHLQLLDVVDPELLFRNYTYVTSVSLGLIAHFEKASEEILRRCGLPDDSFVVEIGSNDGTMLRCFQKRGMRILGIDPARRIAAKATESGIQTLPEFFTLELAQKIRKEFGAADLFVANNVFAHSDVLGEMADGIRELLSSRGVFVFEVSYLPDIIEKSLIDTIFHEHLCYHSIKPLARFLNLHGLELVDVQRIPTKGGSIRAFAQRKGGSREVSSIVEELIRMEEKLGFDQVDTFKAFQSRLDSNKRKFLEIIDGFKSGGKTVAGYGASSTVTTILFYFDLGKRLNFLVDDNPVKQGLFSPGAHIPVFPPQILYEKRPDVVVILAWTYVDPIVKKHQKYREQGGQFIVPLPETKLL